MHQQKEQQHLFSLTDPFPARTPRSAVRSSMPCNGLAELTIHQGAVSEAMGVAAAAILAVMHQPPCDYRQDQERFFDQIKDVLRKLHEDVSELVSELLREWYAAGCWEYRCRCPHGTA